MQALLFSGIAVQMTDAERVIEGAEHLAAHLWIMKVLNSPIKAYHGERVGVAAICLLRTYEKWASLIKEKRVHLKGESARGLEMHLMEQYFNGDLLDEILLSTSPNPLEEVDFDLLEEQLDTIADDIQELPSSGELCSMLKRAGCKTELSDIGLEEAIADKTLELVPYLKKDLSFLRISKLLDWN